MVDRRGMKRRAWPFKMSSIGRILEHAWPYRIRLGIAFACLFAASGVGLIFPMFIGGVVDASFTERSITALNDLTLQLVGVFAIQATFVFFRQYLFGWVAERVVSNIRIKLFSHLIRLSPEFFQRKHTGELVSRLAEDVTKAHGALSSDIPTVIRAIVGVTGAVALSLYTSVYLTVVMLSVVPLIAILAVYFSRKIRALARGTQDKLALANGGLAEGLAGIETVQAFTREQHEIGRYRDAVEVVFGLCRQRITANSWFSSISSFAGMGAIVGIFWLGGTMVATESLSAGELVQFMAYAGFIAQSFAASTGSWANLQSAAGATERIFELLDTEPQLSESPNPVRLTHVRGEVHFDHVVFRYGERGNVLHGIDLRIRPGETCALVGASGSGKSTLSRLVLRFYDPTGGRVTLDGHDLRDLSLSDLRGSMAVVSQEPTLFSGTIADNIRYGRLDATDEDIRNAARLANAHQFVSEFPEGYDTMVGERGLQLSGGQRQRISIARAVLRDPAVLVLDEATSALDAHSEGIVQEALEKLQKGRTTIVIAHRLSTVRSADRIAVLEAGRLVEEGTHNSLMRKQGVYAHLVARQMGEDPVALELQSPMVSDGRI